MSGLVITAIAWSTILSRALVQFSNSLNARLVVLLSMLVLLLVPLPNISAAGVLRGMFGDFSYTTLLLLVLSLAASLGGYRPFTPQQYRGTLWAILAFAIYFYPSSLGYGDVDLYSYGYRADGVLAVVALVGLIAWQEENYLLVLIIATACLTYSLGLMESSNFWDYLLDPFLALYALGYTIYAAVTKRS